MYHIQPSFLQQYMCYGLLFPMEVVLSYLTVSSTQIHFFLKSYQVARRVLKHRGTYLYRHISISRDAHQRSGRNSQLLHMHRKQQKVGQESLFDKLNCSSRSLKHGVGQQQSLPLHLLSVGKRSIIADTPPTLHIHCYLCMPFPKRRSGCWKSLALHLTRTKVF